MDLNHLHLMVKNIATSRQFYETLFGFYEKTQYGPELLFLQNSSGFDLALSPTPTVEPLPKGIHFGFSVASKAELEEYFSKIKAVYPASLQMAAPKDHGDWACTDPDGYTIEIYWDQNLRPKPT